MEKLKDMLEIYRDTLVETSNLFTDVYKYIEGMKSATETVIEKIDFLLEGDNYLAGFEWFSKHSFNDMQNTPSEELPKMVAELKEEVNDVEELDNRINSKHFGMRLKKARRYLGLTQAAMGKLIGVNNTAVSSWERGKTIPSGKHYQTAIEIIEAIENEELTIN